MLSHITDHFKKKKKKRQSLTLAPTGLDLNLLASQVLQLQMWGTTLGGFLEAGCHSTNWLVTTSQPFSVSQGSGCSCAHWTLNFHSLCPLLFSVPKAWRTQLYPCLLSHLFLFPVPWSPGHLPLSPLFL